MKLNIDTTGVTFLCTREPQAKTDRETGAPKVDRETGEAQWQIQLAALDSTGGEVLLVTVAGRPDVGVGSPVAVEDLVAIPWSQGDRSGVAYRAGSHPVARHLDRRGRRRAPASRSARPPPPSKPPNRLRARPRPRIARAGPAASSCDLKERAMVRSESPPLKPPANPGTAW